jgi:hypothetical protein
MIEMMMSKAPERDKAGSKTWPVPGKRSFSVSSNQ